MFLYVTTKFAIAICNFWPFWWLGHLGNFVSPLAHWNKIKLYTRHHQSHVGGQGQWCGLDSFFAKISTMLWTNRRTNGPTDGPTNGPTYKPTNSVTYSCLHVTKNSSCQLCSHWAQGDSGDKYTLNNKNKKLNLLNFIVFSNILVPQGTIELPLGIKIIFRGVNVLLPCFLVYL